MMVYVLTVTADAGRGDFIGTTSVHDTAAGAVAALRAHYDDNADWYAECGVTDWRDFATPVDYGDDMNGFIGRDVELVTGAECDGLSWGINPFTVNTGAGNVRHGIDEWRRGQGGRR
jgi:hypothetical protein